MSGGRSDGEAPGPGANGSSPAEDTPRALRGRPAHDAESSRLRAGLRRHGLARRPGGLREVLAQPGLRFTDGNRVDLYDCGGAAFPAMLDAIAGAGSFVHLETYILRHDRIGLRFLEALADRASDGVDVRLLFDALGSRQLDPRALAPLRRAGGDVVAFNPLRRFWPHWAPRRRDHRKLLVVDGHRAFTGGLNIGDEYDTGPVSRDGSPGWRDSHLGAAGPVVRELGAVFLESWFRAGGPDLPWTALLDVELEPRGEARCAVLPDGPVYRRRAMRDLLVSALDDARERVRLTSPYFVPDRPVLEALERAASRGVGIELILAGMTDHPILRRGARATIERLLRRGVSVYEYATGMLHAKSALFDDRLAIVGSSNLDRQSFQHSYEVNVVLVGASLPRALDRQFEADLAHSLPLTLRGLAQRGPLTRLLDHAAARLVRGFV